MTRSFTVACIQVNAGTDMQANIESASDLVRQAKDQGARMVFMPENVAIMERSGKKIAAKAMKEKSHRALRAFRDLARETGLWLHCGTLAVKENGRVANRTYILNQDGEITAAYDKIHMFDVDLDDGESYRESDIYQAGNKAVVTHTPWGELGLSICYDLRFPHLYRNLAQAGADFLAVPAAFTYQTGRAHWQVLLRARAIETGCYVIASAQTGTHVKGRKTYGHSLIIDPWGKVLADAKTKPGLILAKIDRAEVKAARAKIPALSYDRPYGLPR